jgi:membrane protein implicated in regulation of membrane protease activity
MGSLVALFTGPNIVFSILILLCLLAGVLQIAGLGGETEQDTDADADGDADADTPDALTLFAFLGMGKAPLMVILMLLTGITGLIGLLINMLALPNWLAGGIPWWSLLITGPIGALIATLLTGRISRLIGRALPPVSTTATRAQALVGQNGTVTSPAVDERYGQVRIRDAGGTQITVFAISSDASPIKRGDAVTLESYDAANKRFVIRKQ